MSPPGRVAGFCSYRVSSQPAIYLVQCFISLSRRGAMRSRCRLKWGITVRSWVLCWWVWGSRIRGCRIRWFFIAMAVWIAAAGWWWWLWPIKWWGIGWWFVGCWSGWRVGCLGLTVRLSGILGCYSARRRCLGVSEVKGSRLLDLPLSVWVILWIHLFRCLFQSPFFGFTNRIAPWVTAVIAEDLHTFL